MTGGVMMLAAFFDNLWKHLHGGINFWTLFGLTGTVMFSSRFVVQWYASEKLKQSVIPKNFWHLSLVGGVIQLIYALHIGYIPVILGYLLTPVVAARNLVLIARHDQRPPPGPPANEAPVPDDITPLPQMEPSAAASKSEDQLPESRTVARETAVR